MTSKSVKFPTLANRVKNKGFKNNSLTFQVRASLQQAKFHLFCKNICHQQPFRVLRDRDRFLSNLSNYRGAVVLLWRPPNFVYVQDSIVFWYFVNNYKLCNWSTQTLYSRHFSSLAWEMEPYNYNRYTHHKNRKFAQV